MRPKADTEPAGAAVMGRAVMPDGPPMCNVRQVLCQVRRFTPTRVGKTFSLLLVPSLSRRFTPTHVGKMQTFEIHRVRRIGSERRLPVAPTVIRPGEGLGIRRGWGSWSAREPLVRLVPRAWGAKRSSIWFLTMSDTSFWLVYGISTSTPSPSPCPVPAGVLWRRLPPCLSRNRDAYGPNLKQWKNC